MIIAKKKLLKVSLHDPKKSVCINVKKAVANKLGFTKL